MLSSRSPEARTNGFQSLCDRLKIQQERRRFQSRLLQMLVIKEKTAETLVPVILGTRKQGLNVTRDMPLPDPGY